MAAPESGLHLAVLEHVRRSPRRLTPAAVLAAVRAATGASGRAIRSVIADLLAAEKLTYSYEMGCSFLIESTQRAWQAAPHIWISPPHRSLPKDPSPTRIHVKIGAGAAFGSEGHATTRLCLLALDHLYALQADATWFQGRCIDIGTGSGILALVAAKMGEGRVLALDTDPCARQEAQGNVHLNGLDDRVQISAKAFDTIPTTFDLIIANLRYPTLVRMLPWVREHLQVGGRVVVSGYLRGESERLEARFGAAGLRSCWCGALTRWAAACFAPKGS